MLPWPHLRRDFLCADMSLPLVQGLMLLTSKATQCIGYMSLHSMHGVHVLSPSRALASKAMLL